MSKISSSIDLFKMIKKAAANEKNWNSSTHLNLRIGFGTRVIHDPVCTPNDFKSNGELENEELLFSQQSKDDAREKFVGKKQSSVLKDTARIFDDYLDRLYCDEESPLFHGFLKEMRNTLKDTLLLNRRERWVELLIQNRSMPSENEMKILLEYTKRSDDNWHKGLHPTLDLFPPIVQGSHNPPTFALWKRTENGRSFLGKQQTRQVVDLFAEQMQPAPAREIIQSANSTHAKATGLREPLSIIGLVEIFTGVKSTKLKYSTDPEYKGALYISTNITLYNLMKKAKKWQKYDENIEERFYNVMNPNGSVFTSYVKEELHDFTLHEILQMVKLKHSEMLKFNCGVRIKNLQLDYDVDDDMSA